MQSPNLSQICGPIARDLDGLERALVENLTSEVPLIRDVSTYVVRNGGKRLRPILTFLSARLAATGREMGNTPLPFACAIEYIHTASLLHDDVIDKAPLRRGKPSANARWGGEVSVLVGDFFYCRASELLVQAGDLRVLGIISRAIAKTTEGEVLEIVTKNDLNLSEADCLTIILSKTAVLIGAACEVGGLLGGADNRECALLRSYGENLGMAFQVADDVLDYVSEDLKFGKENGTDLKEGHLTLPIVYALETATPDERLRFKELYAAARDNSGHLGWTRALMDKYGSLRKAMAVAEAYVEKSKEALAAFPPSAAKDSLLALADYVVKRTY